MLKIYCSLFFLFLIKFNGFASQLIQERNDTTDFNAWIIEKMKAFKKQNKLQIHRFNSPDSTITFGSNKERYFLTSVLIIDRIHNENHWFFYDSIGIFRVSVIITKHKGKLRKQKKLSCSYYFENGELIHKKEDGITRDTQQLLGEARNYQALAIPYLRKK